METIIKTSIDVLTDTSVSINTQTFIEVEGEQIVLKNHRKAYVNSQSGRAKLESEQSVNTVKAILTIWGDKPVIEEKAE